MKSMAINKKNLSFSPLNPHCKNDHFSSAVHWSLVNASTHRWLIIRNISTRLDWNPSISMSQANLPFWKAVILELYFISKSNWNLQKLEKYLNLSSEILIHLYLIQLQVFFVLIFFIRKFCIEKWSVIFVCSVHCFLFISSNFIIIILRYIAKVIVWINIKIE